MWLLNGYVDGARNLLFDFGILKNLVAKWICGARGHDPEADFGIWDLGF